MAKFLTRLAGRTLGTIPLAEPVVPVRFTPTTDKGGWRASAQNSEPAQISSRTSFQARQHLADPFAAQSTQIESEALLSAHRRRTALPEVESGEAALLPHATHARLTGTAAFEDTNLASSPHSFVRFPRHAHPSVKAVPETDLDALAAPVSEHAITEPRTFVTRIRPPFAEPAESASLNQARQGARGPMGLQADFNAASRSVPIVHVTIGRIDVRAEIAAPAPTASGARARPATLSLNEFLNGRNGNGRSGSFR